MSERKGLYMGKRIKIIIAAVLALIILLVLWYTRPRMLDSALGLEGKTVTDMSVSLMFVDGQYDEEGIYWPYHRAFSISHEDVDHEAVLDLLRSSRYRYSLRSLFHPKGSDAGNADGFVVISMILDGEKLVSITVSDPVSISLDGRPGLIIAKSSNELYPLLKDYICRTGTEGFNSEDYLPLETG